MDIRKWSMSEIMQLPDWCFGRRWFVGSYMGSTGGLAYYYLGEDQLPERFVVWGVLVASRSPNCLEALRLTIRLGQHTPSDVADALKMDRLFKDISTSSILYEFYVPQNGTIWLGCQRVLITSLDRRLALVSNGDQSIAYEMTVGVLISEVPREVPDWLIGAKCPT